MISSQVDRGHRILGSGLLLSVGFSVRCRLLLLASEVCNQQEPMVLCSRKVFVKGQEKTEKLTLAAPANLLFSAFVLNLPFE